jgi:hypothetical protein
MVEGEGSETKFVAGVTFGFEHRQDATKGQSLQWYHQDIYFPFRRC